MPQSFFELNLERRRRFLDEAARALGRSPVLLEKDIYVCWALQTLFALPAPVMVFKGGTSLSKVYRAIDRFSEDLDLTLDHRLSGDLLQDPVSASGNGRARFGERMKRYTAQQIEHVIKPHFEPHLASVGATRLEVVGAEREQLLLSYASPYGESYVLPQIRLEFGSKNATEPQESHLIQTDVLAWPVAAQLEFPSANVRVLSIERTFWEKVTLIHAEVTRRGRRLGVERYSRHWYDLAQLSVGAVAEKALRRSEVRDSVIDTKSALYAVAGVNYRQVSSGACRLSEPSLNARLEADYEAMHGAGMFEGIPPSWSTVIQRLEHLEEQINALAPDDYAP